MESRKGRTAYCLFVYRNTIGCLFSRSAFDKCLRAWISGLLIEVFTKSSGSTDIYRNQFHIIEDEVSAFTA